MSGRYDWNRMALRLALSAGVFLGAPAAHAEPLKRFPFDDAQVRRLSVNDPRGSELFARGEEELRRLDFAKAAEIFGEVAKSSPQIGIVHRRHCQALTELGKRAEAVAACQRAFQTSGTPMDRRALVGALMLGDAPLDTEQLNTAIHLATSARDRLPDQPWGLAAECDIARHLKDERAYQGCVERLERLVPQHFETQRAAAIIPPPKRWLRIAGWIGVVGLLLFTAGHALRRKLGLFPRKTLGAALALLGVFRPDVASAEPGAPAASDSARPMPGEEHWQLSRWRIKIDDPESSVPAPAERDKNPLEFGYHLQDLSAEAKKAEDKGDYRTAVKFWRAVAKAVPDSNAGFFRACTAYEALGERERAIDFCGKGLTLPPDYPSAEAYRYSKLVLARDGRPNALEIQALDQVTLHLRESKKPLAAFYSEQIQCELALELDDEPRLANCTANLVKLAPRDLRTVSYRWSLAVKREDFQGAEKAIADARALQMKPEALAELERGTRLALDARQTRRAKLGLGVAGVGLLLGLLILGFRRFVSQRKVAPTTTSASAPV